MVKSRRKLLFIHSFIPLICFPLIVKPPSLLEIKLSEDRAIFKLCRAARKPGGEEAGRPGVRVCARAAQSSRLDRWTGIRSPTAWVSHSLIYPTRANVAHGGGQTALHALKDYYTSLPALGANGKMREVHIYLFGLFYEAETFWCRFRRILSSKIRRMALAKQNAIKGYFSISLISVLLWKCNRLKITSYPI